MLGPTQNGVQEADPQDSVMNWIQKVRAREVGDNSWLPWLRFRKQYYVIIKNIACLS